MKTQHENIREQVRAFKKWKVGPQKRNEKHSRMNSLLLILSECLVPVVKLCDWMHTVILFWHMTLCRELFVASFYYSLERQGAGPSTVQRHPDDKCYNQNINKQSLRDCILQLKNILINVYYRIPLIFILVISILQEATKSKGLMLTIIRYFMSIITYYDYKLIIFFFLPERRNYQTYFRNVW